MSGLPKEYMNSFGKIESQRDSSFCSAFATTSLLTSYFSRIHGEVIEFSPLFAMQNAKKVDGTNSKGTYLTKLLDQVVKYGCCEQSYYHEDLDEDWNDNRFPDVDDETIENAKKYKPLKKCTIQKGKQNVTLDNIKSAIANNGGCLFAINCFENYFDKYQGVFIRKPKKDDGNVIGRHSIYIAGYSDNLECEYDNETYKGFLIYAESYGDRTLSGGLCYIPYDFILNNVGGLYSVDRFVDEIYYFGYDETKVKHPNFSDNNKPFLPQREIKLTIDDPVAYVNGKKVILDTPPQILGVRTMIPFRFLAEAFECSVSFKESDKSIIALRKEPNYVIEMKVGDNVFVKRQGGKRKEIIGDVPPTIIGIRTMIPIRVVGELLDCNVYWDNDKREVRITGRL